jgi:8-oxo-dGTP diphosphatase
VKEKNPKRHCHVTAGLISRDGRLLVTKRPEGKHLAGFWEFPGGKQEENETLEACLEREIKEELGMEVHAVKHVLTIDHTYEDRSISLHLFECAEIRGEPKPLESPEIRWVLPHQLSQYRLPPPDLKILPAVIKHVAEIGRR